MTSTKRLPVGTLADLPEGACRSVQTELGYVAIYNVAGRLYATDDVCPHAGGPLGEGTLDGDCVACPWHGWRFKVTTGQRVDNPAIQVDCFPVHVDGGEIFVDVPTERTPF